MEVSVRRRSSVIRKDDRRQSPSPPLRLCVPLPIRQNPNLRSPLPLPLLGTAHSGNTRPARPLRPGKKGPSEWPTADSFPFLSLILLPNISGRVTLPTPSNTSNASSAKMAVTKPAAPKSSTGKTKSSGQKYFIDFSGPAADGILDAAGFEKFLHDRIKVDGKAGQLGEVVKVSKEGK